MAYDFIIVGAGIAGLTVAEQVANRLNKKVLLIDKRDHIGGNCYDYYNEEGILVHKYGPHIFHTDSIKVYKYLSRFTNWNIYNHKVVGKIDGDYVPLPFNLISIDKCMPEESEDIKTALLEKYNVNDKIYKNYYVGNCKKTTDYVYASKEITFDIGSGDKLIDIVPFLAYTRNATLDDNTKIIFISLPGAIIFKYYPRQINMESIKSGSSGFVDFSSLRELVGGTCICKARIYKLPDAAITITDGIFRSVCGYGNNKTTYGRGYVSNSSGQITGSVTIPEGDRTDYVDIYIRFDNVYEGGYYGQMCQLSFEINIDGGWKQVPPGGSYIMH